MDSEDSSQHQSGADSTPRSRPRPRWRTGAVVATSFLLVALLGWLLTSRDSPTPVQTTADGKIIEEFAPGDRASVDSFEAETLDGSSFDSAALLGRVTVYNTWGSWCGPCRTEAPALARVARETDAEVTFVGINMRDNDDAARAFERTYGVPYESITTETSGVAILAFGSALSSAAIPSTVVVDREGRVAARVVGPVTVSTLRALVTSVLAEGSSAP